MTLHPNARLTPFARELMVERVLRLGWAPADAAQAAGVVLPPVLMIGLLGVVWQLLCSSPDASLPPPTKVLTDTWELITQPFYDNGGIDKGLFWHLLASLKRVAPPEDGSTCE